MFFTQDDYRKIQEWLQRNSVKDTEFQEADIPLNGNEVITLVQNGHNKKVHLKDLIEQMFSIGVTDFVNVSSLHDKYNITLNEAIQLVPHKSRKKGQVITFCNTDNVWKIYQFTGVKNQWNILDLWNDLFDWTTILEVNFGPDEEDITANKSEDNIKLSFKDRVYEPDSHSGLGYKILRKNIVTYNDPVQGELTKNILVQNKVAQSNTIYEIRYDFDLNNQTINIPENSVLQYKGGSLNNGKIVYNNTIIEGIERLNNVTTEGDYTYPYTGDETNPDEQLAPTLAQVRKLSTEVTNIADDEDLTKIYDPEKGQEVLQLKDRQYVQGSNSGMGYVILRQNKSFAEQVIKANTIYEIRYDFDLGGEEVEIPENCVLKFDGGSLSNGILSGDNTKLSAPQIEIFNNITISGGWNTPIIYQSWFNFKKGEGYDNILNFQNMLALTSADVVNNVYYDNGDYYTSVEQETLQVKSNTSLHLGACHIVEIPHGHNFKSLIVIKNCSMVNIYGGILTGDAVEHDYNSGEHQTFEHNHGIKIGGNSKTITIKDTVIEKMTGDGIDIVSNDESIYGIVIDNVVCSANNRQGLSIESGSNIKVINSEFVDTSSIHNTAPGAGIDIEPYINTTSVSDIIIDNCKLRGNKGESQLLIQANAFKDDNTYDNKIRLSNLVIDGKISANKNVNIDISNVSSTKPIAISGCVSVRLRDCKLSGLTFVNTEDINIEKTTSTVPIDFNYGENVTMSRLSSDLSLYSGVKNVSVNDSTIPKLHLENTDNLNINYCEIGELKWQNASNVLLSKSKITNQTSQGSEIITNVNISDCDLGTITFPTFRFSDMRIAKSKLTFNQKITTDGTSNIHIEDCFITAIEQIRVSSSSWELINNHIIFTGDEANDKSAILLVGNEYSINLIDNIFENCKSIITTNFGNEIINIKSEQAIPITTDNWVTKCVKPKEGCVERQGVSMRRFIGGKWISDATINAGTDKPIGVEVGYSYFDTSIGKPIYWTGSKWVDATGAEV